MIPRILNPAMIDTVWKQLEPFLVDAIENSSGELELGDLKHRIEDTRSLALCVLDGDTLCAVALLENVIFPSSKRVLGIIALSGIRIDEWIDKVNDALIEIAQEQECNEVRIIGSPSWAKHFENVGWTTTHVILSKRI